MAFRSHTRVLPKKKSWKITKLGTYHKPREKAAALVQKQMAELSRQNEHAAEELRREVEELKTKQKEMIDGAIIFERMDNWFRSSNPKELEVSIWQFLNEEGPAGHKPEDFPELVAAAKRLQALRRAEEEKK